jgi:heme A synthase
MQGMPSYESAPTVAPVERPASIAQAVKLMYVGAALSLLGIIVTVLMKGAIRDAVEKASEKATTPMTDTQIDAAVTLGVTFAVITGLIGVALWVWMASANGKGRKWARIVATILFVLSVLSILSSLLQHPPALALILNLVMLALGAYILYLLYRPESTQYYEAQSAPRI